MVNISKIAAEIVKKEVPSTNLPEKSDTVVTSVPRQEIDDALELTNQVIELLNGYMSDANNAIDNLSGSSAPSVLESKDDFKSLVLKLKNMKKKLTLV